MSDEVGGSGRGRDRQPGRASRRLAIRAAGPEAVFDVIDVFDPDALERLAAYAAGERRQLPGFW